MIKQASQRSMPLRFSILSSAHVDGVGTQQIVHTIPSGHDRLDQVRPAQPVEQMLCPLNSGISESSSGIGVQVGAGVQAEEAEHPGCVSG